jgi:hypothetical protein
MKRSLPICVMFWISADHCYKGIHEKRQNKNNLATGQPEFGLSIGTDNEDV